MIKEKTLLDKIQVYKLEPFKDHRGEFIELYNKEDYDINLDFIQDDISISHKDVIRGIHGDMKTWKLISCLNGEFLAVVVECDIKSKQRWRWESIRLSRENTLQLLIPPTYGLGVRALKDNSILHYKQTEYYEGSYKQFTYRWDDQRIGIDWGITNPILSKRDSK